MTVDLAEIIRMVTLAAEPIRNSDPVDEFALEYKNGQLDFADLVLKLLDVMMNGEDKKQAKQFAGSKK